MEVNSNLFVIRERCPLCAAGQGAQVVADLSMIGSEVGGFIRQYYGGRVPEGILSGASYTVLHCGTCDFYWQRHVLNDRWMRELYDVWIDPVQSFAKKASPDLAQRLRTVRLLAFQLSAVVGSKQEISVLDWGGGWGTWCQAARALGCTAYLMDLSRVRVGHNQPEGVMRVTSLVELKGVLFDLINAAQVLEHVPDPLDSLRDLVALLGEGGGISISVPDAGTQRHPAGQVRKGPHQPLEHINGFIRKSVRYLVQHAGLEMSRSRVFSASSSLGVGSLLKEIIRNMVVELTPAARLPRGTTSVFAIKPRRSGIEDHGSLGENERCR